VSSKNQLEGELSAGQMLGRYELLTPIASGGMGNVWAARLKGTRGFRKLVAIKTILRSLEHPQLEQMLSQEALLASQIHHPNVAEMLELGEQDGTLYLVMELVQGESLAYILREAQAHGGVPFPVAINLVGQVCRGLTAAHNLRDERGRHVGLIHRDISPPNVLVDDSGTVKIVDFGVATTASSATFGSGEIKGKISYLAPEQLRGETLDARVDVFTTGILLYLLTVGRHPFRAQLESATIARILSDEPATPPSALNEEYPESLELVVLKALDKDRDTRFQSAEELLEGLERAWPDAFGPTADEAVAQYVQEITKDRQDARRATLRLAEELAEQSSPRDSVRSMPALSANTLPPRKASSPKAAWLALGLLFTGLGAGAVALPRYLQLLQPAPTGAPVADAATEPVAPRAAMQEAHGVAQLPPPPTSVDTATAIAATAAEQLNPSLAVPSAQLAAPVRGMPQRSARRSAQRNAEEASLQPELAASADDEAPAAELASTPPVSLPAAEPAPTALAAVAPAPLVVPAATLAPSYPIAPVNSAPRTLSSRLGHAQLAINPSAEAYRVRLPSAIERLGENFQTTVSLCVNTNGSVSKVNVLRSAGPAVDSALVKALSRWRYRPLLEDGSARPFCYVFSYDVVGQ